MFRSLPGRVSAWGKNCKYRSVILLVFIGTCALATVILLHDRKFSEGAVTQIVRNTYGGGDVTKSFRVFIDGREEEQSLEVTVGEKQYTREEMDRVFAKVLRKLEAVMLGENQSLDAVDTDLNLITEIEGEPVEISWELDRYDLVNIYGELNAENLREEPEGALVSIKAYLTYTEDPGIQMMKEMAVRVYPPATGESTGIAALRTEIEEEEEKTKTLDIVEMPSEVNGKKVRFQNQENPRGWYIFLLGCLVCVLLGLLQIQEEKQEKAKRNQQMMLDYPEIVNKLTLLLGAGMTVKNAWQKIVTDYEIQKERQGERWAYEEMLTASHEMQSGVAEMESYENFGRRCQNPAYRKLAALLTQNLRKGTKGITELLGLEAMSAFEERKASAKKRGEEAGTKLLAPMFLMLAMVLVMVIVPAFLSVQI